MNGKSPDAFRTISEVAEWLGVNTHVLRFWESKFTQVKPVKRAGGRRYYRRGDMELLGGIQKLLHEDGMTIKGVQKILRDQGVRSVCAMSKPVDPEETPLPDSAMTSPPQPEPQTAEVAVPSEPSALDQGVEDMTVAPVQPSSDTPDAMPTDDDAPAELEPRPAQAMPLFAHHEEAPDSATTEPGEAPLLPDDGGADVSPDPAPPAPSGPIIAPLPGPELTLAEALSRLVPLQISPAFLVPIHARMVDLRTRMDRAG